MKIALIAPPFIAVPPKKYGGTELFVAELAKGLQAKGQDVVLYTNGDSTLDVPTRWLYKKEQWPLSGEVEGNLKALDHAAWAVRDAIHDADIIHLNSALGLGFSKFVDLPVVYTVHHSYEQALTDHYGMSPEVHYVTISDFQRAKLNMPKMRTIHHGIDPALFQVKQTKQPYLSFLGRIAPLKGTHIAIEVARKAGIPLKIAGEIQPLYKEFWETVVRPQVDGKFIEYVGEVGLAEKNVLLGNSLALLFPVQWEEPFGLTMIEAMACGTPVLATPGGSVAEVVKEGVSGHVRGTVDELAECVKTMKFQADAVRKYVEEHFSAQRMTRDYLELYSQALQQPQIAAGARVVA